MPTVVLFTRRCEATGAAISSGSLLSRSCLIALSTSNPSLALSAYRLARSATGKETE
nr:MAG TPA: hypothetical protein [Caudoviricetes sp.]